MQQIIYKYCCRIYKDSLVNSKCEELFEINIYIDIYFRYEYTLIKTRRHNKTNNKRHGNELE